jgi:Txe/YoeB family toxin of toxin-antitoxin system
MYKIVFTKEASKGIKFLRQKKALLKRADELIEIMKQNPYQNPPPYEKLEGRLSGLYSRRINIQHRLVYGVEDNEKIVYIHSVWSHYEF